MRGPCLSSLSRSTDGISADRHQYRHSHSLHSRHNIFPLFTAGMMQLGPGPSLRGCQCSVLSVFWGGLALVLFCSAVQKWLAQMKDVPAGITFERNRHLYKVFLGAFIDPVVVNKKMCRKRVGDFFYNDFFQEPLIWLKVNRKLVIYIF